MSSLQKKVELLESNGFVPRGLNMPIDYKIVDVQAVLFDYTNYKYAESDENYRNVIISIEMKNKFVENSFFVNIFDGTTYRDTNILNVTVSLEPVIVNGTETVDYLEVNDCITKDAEANIDGMETFSNIAFAFSCRLFDGDEAFTYINEDEFPTLNKNYGLLGIIANGIVELDYLILNEKISKVNPVAENLASVYSKIKDVAEDKLYKVTVIVDNELLCFIPFLSKEKAEKSFISCCIEYTPDIGLNKEQMSLTQWQEYMNTKDHTKDSSFIAMSFM